MPPSTDEDDHHPHCAKQLTVVQRDGTLLCSHRLAGVSKREELMQEGKLLTVSEVAELLHYSVKTVYKKAARGEIPSIVISNRKRLFDREIINYWLVQRQTGDL